MIDERTYHRVNIDQSSTSDNDFVVDTRYTGLERIGQGAYGCVVSALDSETGKRVAIKRVKHVFEDMVKAKRILREIKLLAHFHGHENLISISDIMTGTDTHDFDDIYMVCKLMESDLDQIITSPQPLSRQHHQYFLHQILRGLHYIHSANVIHRDLKPGNILVNSNCDLALCDFGLSRGLAGDVDHEMTEYVVTRWYRSPELLCETNTYGKSVDIWSVGCIFAELLSRKPFFQGNNPHHQLTLIVSILGCPNQEELGFTTHPVARLALQRASRSAPTGLKQNLSPDVDEDALDLLSKMLVMNPDERITVEEALKHPYLSDLYSENEPQCDSIFIEDKRLVQEEDLVGLRKLSYQLVSEEILKLKNCPTHSCRRQDNSEAVNQSTYSESYEKDMTS
mmetsp:Transcript_4793/g.5780  ORF Transcript_4793/g.5780 Transcript_4793/m.5780 type:complete len:396 (-) Transcript_4793:48-1235(-)